MESASLMTAPAGLIRSARALACVLLVGLMTLPLGGLDALAARPAESAACNEEYGSESELTTAVGRHAHPAPDAGRPTGTDTLRSLRAARTTTTHVPPPSGRNPAVFRLRC